MSEQEAVFHTIKDNCKKRHEDLVLWKKKMANYSIDRGEPEASIVVEIELVLDQYRTVEVHIMGDILMVYAAGDLWVMQNL
jgi:hypothetical protein